MVVFTGLRHAFYLRLLAYGSHVRRQSQSSMLGAQAARAFMSDEAAYVHAFVPTPDRGADPVAAAGGMLSMHA